MSNGNLGILDVNHAYLLAKWSFGLLICLIWANAACLIICDNRMCNCVYRHMERKGKHMGSWLHVDAFFPLNVRWMALSHEYILDMRDIGIYADLGWNKRVCGIQC